MPKRISRRLGALVVRCPVWIVLAFVLAAAVSAWLAATRLGFKTDQNDLVGADLEYNQRYLEFLEEFGDLEFVYAVIEVGDDPARAMEVVEAIAAELAPLTEPAPGRADPLVEWIFHRVPPEEMKFGLLHGERQELESIVGALTAQADMLDALSRIDGFPALLRAIAAGLRPGALAGGAAGGAGDASARVVGEWGLRIVRIALAAVRDAVTVRDVVGPRRALEDTLGLPPVERGYLGTHDGSLLLVEIQPVKDTRTTELIREPLAAIRAALDRVRARFPGARFGITGRPVLQADEMRTTDRDMRIATVCALLGVLLLSVLFFRRLKRPFLAVVALSVSIILTFGVVAVTIGYLTLLTIVFAAMLVGLGIDFGIHLVARYQEELAAGRSIDEAITETLETTGSSITTGAVTTAVAFYTILLVDFRGLRELGFIAGSGVLLCLLCMVLLLPALLALSDRRALARGGFSDPRPVRVPGLPWLTRHPRLALAALLLPSGVGILAVREPLPYDSNLIELQAVGLESVRYEKLIMETSDFSTWYGAFTVPDRESIRTTLERLEPARERGVIGRTESILDYLPEEQEAKLALLGRVWDRVRDLAVPAPAPLCDPEALLESLDSLLDSVDDLASASVRGEDVDAARELGALAAEVEAVIEAIAAEPEAASLLTAAQGPWIREFGSLLSSLRGAFEPRPISEATLPEVLRRRLVSEDGKRYLVYACPDRDIWEESAMEEFITALRSVDPDVTGAPIQVWESGWRIRRGFLLAALYALISTFLLLWIDLRRLPDALLAMVPLVFGLLWLIECLPLVGLEFNLANFFSLPILIGCGIDGGVHVVHRFRETGRVEDVTRTTCSAVTLSFLTTMTGFGAMMVAHHRGVFSLGAMMTLGLSCLLVATVVLLPCLLGIRQRRRQGG